MEKLFYLQDLRQYLGNGIMWWAPGGKGYTSDIRNAEKMRATEAVKLVNLSDKYRAWPVDYIDNLLEAHVLQIDMQYVDWKHSIESEERTNQRKRQSQF